MESPASWGEAEKVVHQVLREDADMRASGEFRAGLSLTSRITGALRARGLLVDEKSEE